MSKFTLSSADPLETLRIELLRELGCPGLLSCFMEQLRETPKLTTTQYKDNVRASLDTQHSVSQAALLIPSDRMKSI